MANECSSPGYMPASVMTDDKCSSDCEFVENDSSAYDDYDDVNFKSLVDAHRDEKNNKQVPQAQCFRFDQRLFHYEDKSAVSTRFLDRHRCQVYASEVSRALGYGWSDVDNWSSESDDDNEFDDEADYNDSCEDDDGDEDDDDDDDPRDDMTRLIVEITEATGVDHAPWSRMATKLSLKHISLFFGLHNESEISLLWLRSFIYEMSAVEMDADNWCLPFELRLRDGATHWFRQLPKRTRQKWKLLSKAFVKYYCSQLSQTPMFQYFMTRRDQGEHLCDYLNRLNWLAQSAHLRIAAGCRDASMHVQQFLISCGDDHVFRTLYHDQVSDIYELEGVIRDILIMEEHLHNTETLHRHIAGRDASNDCSNSSFAGQGNPTKRSAKEYRAYSNSTGMTLAEASLDDILCELQCRESISSGTEYLGQTQQVFRGEEGILDYCDDIYGTTEGSLDNDDRYVTTTHDGGCTWSETDMDIVPSRSDNFIHGGNFDQCEFCGKVHIAGQCEYYQLYQDLLEFVYKQSSLQDLPSDLQASIYGASPSPLGPLATPPVVQTGVSLLAEPPLIAERIYAYRGEFKQSVHDLISVIGTEVVKEPTRGASTGGEEGTRANQVTSECSNGVLGAVKQSGEPSVYPSVMKLNPGERLGWWSTKTFDRRNRMLASIKGAVNDTRTSVLLDSGANVSLISERFASELRLPDVSNNGRIMEIQGINDGKASTTRRVFVKITLGWNTVYEFKMWVMPHNAGIEVVLGMDFMVSAGIRLDLFHGAARLPNEVSIPLVKTQNEEDDEDYDVHVIGGPSEVLNIPGHECVEFQLHRKPPSPQTHEFWIRKTKTLVPTVIRFRRGRPLWVRLTNISERSASCPSRFPIGLWVPIGEFPREVGYVRLTSIKYADWQVLAYEGSKSSDLFTQENTPYHQLPAFHYGLDPSTTSDTPPVILESVESTMASVQRYANEASVGSPEVHKTVARVCDSRTSVRSNSSDDGTASITALERTYISVILGQTTEANKPLLENADCYQRLVARQPTLKDVMQVRQKIQTHPSSTAYYDCDDESSSETSVTSLGGLKGGDHVPTRKEDSLDNAVDSNDIRATTGMSNECSNEVQRLRMTHPEASMREPPINRVAVDGYQSRSKETRLGRKRVPRDEEQRPVNNEAATTFSHSHWRPPERVRPYMERGKLDFRIATWEY